MAQTHEAVTDRLVDLITRIKMERGSGQLRVRRGEGLTSEEGILTFMQGQITQASVGRRSGAQAFNWLCSWVQARYVFITAGPALTDLELYPAQPTTERLETEPLPGNREIPRSRVDFQEASKRIERAGLSRSHRRLYLLINGQRSIDDLEPLTGKKLVEVRSMLQDLEWLEIIHLADRMSEL